jgi:tRNA nucleotidyltransferase (CCA-adding enzyme)
MLIACEADARGRGPERRVAPYPQAALLRALHEAAAVVRLPPDVLAVGRGPEIGASLRDARIEAIRYVKTATMTAASNSR